MVQFAGLVGELEQLIGQVELRRVVEHSQHLETPYVRFSRSRAVNWVELPRDAHKLFGAGEELTTQVVHGLLGNARLVPRKLLSIDVGGEMNLDPVGFRKFQMLWRGLPSCRRNLLLNVIPRHRVRVRIESLNSC